MINKKKIFWMSILIIIFSFLRILDMYLTSIALNHPNLFIELNGLVSNSPLLWFIMNFSLIGVFYIINIILWVSNKEKDTMEDIIFLMNIILICSIVINIINVTSNIIALFIVL